MTASAPHTSSSIRREVSSNCETSFPKNRSATQTTRLHKGIPSAALSNEASQPSPLLVVYLDSFLTFAATSRQAISIPLRQRSIPTARNLGPFLGEVTPEVSLSTHLEGLLHCSPVEQARQTRWTSRSEHRCIGSGSSSGPSSRVPTSTGTTRAWLPRSVLSFHLILSYS